MMRFVLMITCILFFLHPSFSQDTSIVKWEVVAKKITPMQMELTLKGNIRKGWYLYAADLSEGLSGPVLSFEDSAVRKTIPVFKTKYVSISDPVFENSKKLVAKDVFEFTQVVTAENPLASVLRFTLNYEVADKSQFITEEFSSLLQLDSNVKVSAPVRVLIPTININHPIADCGGSTIPLKNSSSGGLLSIFLLGFLGGLVALFTPCVFPMIPLTVSFFTKKAITKKAGIFNAFLYGFFIFLIYILLSLPFHFLDSVNPAFLNNISTNVLLNVIFFIIFIAFSFAFFGFYEIALPASLSTGSDSKAGVGNIVGIFFMALTLAIVSFSCTGPILGSLLAGSLSSDGGAIQLSAGMAGFGLALALPFALFALFPGWLNALPKSGGWLNTIKVVLGFLELAMAFKFLSNADLVKHWGILKREIFIGIWILIGILLTLYLLGKIKFPHDSPRQKISAGRKISALITGLFVLYLLPGITQTKWANLSLISGFPPPMDYSIYQKTEGGLFGLNMYKEYEEGLRKSREEKKPLLLDFTGYACVNCRRMEENVWNNPSVLKLLKENFIMVSLYVDDKKKLPASKQFVYTSKDKSHKKISTVGDLWSTFESENFADNAQPLYALINNEEKLLNYPIGYTPSVEDYIDWLTCGLKSFKLNQ